MATPPMVGMMRNNRFRNSIPLPTLGLDRLWRRAGERREAEALLVAEDLIHGEAADRGVEKFDHVKGRLGAFTATAEAAHELEEAAGVGRDDGLGVGVEKMADLAVAELLGGFWLEEIVDTG